MNTYEFTISEKAVAKDGLATVSSICGYMISAAYRTLTDEGYGMCILSKCTIEIDERPKRGEIINLIVDSGVNTIVSLLNRNVVLTDSEGIEIGRGKIEWLMPKVTESTRTRVSPARLAKRFITKFQKIVPNTEAIADLQMRIDLDFSRNTVADDDYSVAFKKICDSRYFFLARSDSGTLCRGMFQTA